MSQSQENCLHDDHHLTCDESGRGLRCNSYFVTAVSPDYKKPFWIFHHRKAFLYLLQIISCLSNVMILQNFIRNQVSVVRADLKGKSGVIPALSRNCEGEPYFCKPLTKENVVMTQVRVLPGF